MRLYVDNYNHSEQTFMDGLNVFLLNEHVEYAKVARVNDFIGDEEYDTDAIEMDADGNGRSNIATINKQYYNALRKYIYYTKR